MHTGAPTAMVQRGIAFLAGVGFAAVPTVGPYLAVLGAFGGGLALQRADRWWWAAALLLGLPWALSGHTGAALGTTAQILAVWLIFRSASAFRGSLAGRTYTKELGAGLLIGLTAAIALGLERAGEWRLETARSVFDLVAWSGNPSLFAHAMLVLAALLALVLPSPRGRVVALALGAAAVAVAGAQEAVLAWLLVALGLRFVGRRGSRATVVAEWALIALMVVVATGVTTSLGTGRTGFRVDLTADGASVNLFRGVEAPSGDWWYPLEVRFAAAPGVVGGEARTVYEVTKQGADPFARLQQIVRLEPGRSYVLSVAWRGQDPARPGLDGWGRAGPDAPSDTLAATWSNGAWQVAATGAMTVVEAAVREVGDGWRRGHVAFRYDGPTPLVWYVGLVPDRRPDVGATTSFAELQLVEGVEAVAYVPLPPDRGQVDLQTTRLPLWAAALDAIAERPWLGWGPSGFVTAGAAIDPAGALQRPFAAHAHALVLDTWVERGVVGVAGLLLLGTLLALRVVQQRDRAAALVLAAVVLLNLFETTFFNGAVIYPLAAVLGWRAVGHRPVARAQTGVGSATLVRVALAASDVVLAALAVSVAVAATGGGFAAVFSAWTPILGYATLLWPAFALASGLYPGYGMPRHDELRRTTRAAAAAAVSLAALNVVLPDAASLAPTSLLLVGTLTVVGAPVVRAVTKGLLRSTRVWGRPVAILGTGTAAERVARHLTEHPEVGLVPVMVFGEGPWGLSAVPVSGRLEAAWEGIPNAGIQHVIAVPDASHAVSYDEVLRRLGRRVHTLQFVPDLHGLPTAGVAVAPIGTTLGLEAKNRLASPLNRSTKRAFDVAAVVLGGLAIVPLLAALAVAIRLDSPGPVLYRQQRVGRGGKAFRVWKFRSMVVDADARLAALLASDPRARAEWDATQKLVRDPRVTRVGGLLRRTSLDELPQLWNVLMGEMSLVGPRPIVEAEIPKYGEAFDMYTQVRPGLTGVWQVSGRSDTSYAYRVELDAYYVRNWSVWLDFDVLVRTFAVVVRREGAY